MTTDSSGQPASSAGRSQDDDAAQEGAPWFTVGDLAGLSGVTVRTLHHYDAIGLLSPSERTASRHRRYSPADLRRLRQVLFYRELGFTLPGIVDVLADPDADPDQHLRRQHRLLRQQEQRTRELLAAVEQEMQTRRMGLALTPQEQLEIFGTELFAERFTEAAAGWGSPDEADQVLRRGTACTAEDWVLIKAEAEAGIQAFAELIRAGEPSGGTRAMDAAEQHRRHLVTWFRPCTPDQHREVAAQYLADPDTASWDEIAPGYSLFVAEAIRANATRQEAAPPDQGRPGAR